MHKKNFVISLFIILFISINVMANIEKYLKKIKTKTDFHKMRNIDFIYLINLNERPEKLKYCIDQLFSYGICPYRFSAVNGWKLSLKTINELGIKLTKELKNKKLKGSYYPINDNGKFKDEYLITIGRNYFSHRMSRGAIGIVLSHLSIVRDAYYSNYKRIWVMEDDVQLIKNPHLISDKIEELDHLVGPNGWDILFTDKDTKDRTGKYVPCFSFAQRPNFQPANPNIFKMKKIISSDFRQIGARYGAYSMIINRCGIEKIFKFFKEKGIFLPYDMEYTLIPNIKLFTVIDDIVSTKIDAPSDNGKPYYLNKN